jgi:hypothetical protein
MTIKTDFEEAEVGRKLGTVTIDVYELNGGGGFAASPTVKYSEALPMMEANLSANEVKVVAEMFMALIVDASALFAYVQNPDKFNKELLK